MRATRAPRHWGETWAQLRGLETHAKGVIVRNVHGRVTSGASWVGHSQCDPQLSFRCAWWWPCRAPHSAGQSGSTPAPGFGEAASGRERPASSRAGPGSRKSQAGRGRFGGSGGPGGPASHSRKRFPTESRVFVRPAREVRALTCRSQVTGLGWGGAVRGRHQAQTLLLAFEDKMRETEGAERSAWVAALNKRSFKNIYPEFRGEETEATNARGARPAAQARPGWGARPAPPRVGLAAPGAAPPAPGGPGRGVRCILGHQEPPLPGAGPAACRARVPGPA